LSEQEHATPKGDLIEDLEDLYENAPCGYLSLGADGDIVKVNRTLTGWLEVDAGELLGKRFHDLLNVPGKIFYETHFAPLLRMQGFFNEVAFDLVGSGDKRIAVFANAVERRADDGSLRFTRVTLFQAGERRRYERQLVEARNMAERSNQKLQGVNEGLEKRVTENVFERQRLQRGLFAEREITRIREQFVAILGHDLRNPLSSIVGGLNILGKEPQTEKSKKVLDLMRRSTDRMFSLVHDMLDFARLRSGAGIAVEIADLDLRPVLEQVVEELRTSHPGRVIECNITLPPALPCDPARIAQLVSNLLGNALTHGAVDKPVQVAADVAERELIIAVTNRGEPIPADAQERLFQPFFRAGASSGSAGLGLGLYIAGEIAQSHGGKLEVASGSAQTTFSFRMPIQPS
jgi:sigma-B regulation protein RsbU (phosphoserine phosphatase)